MHPLDGAFLKLKWADHQLKVLNQAIQAWRDKQPYKVVGNPVTEGYVQKHLFTVQENVPIPSDFNLIVGDVCNSARSVLDYILWQLHLLKNPAFDENVTFPVFDFYDGRDGKHGFKFRAARSIRDLRTNQQTLVESVQPYHAGYEALSFLRDLNNGDKHRVIQVLGLSARTGNFGLETFKGHPAVGPVQYRIAERVEVKQGAILAELLFPPDFVWDKVGVYGDFEFTMAFRGSKTADGRNIETTLRDCIAAVRDVLFTFEPEFFCYGYSSYNGWA